MTEARARPPLGPTYWPSWLGVGLLYVVGRFPAPVLAVLGEVTGALLYRVLKERRGVAERNISACFPALDRAAQRRLVRRHFGCLGRSVYETGVFWWASRSRLSRLVRIQGAGPYEGLRRAGRPIILLAPHFVGVQAGIALTLGRPIANYYRPVNNPVFAYVYRRQMARFGAVLLPRAAGVRATLRVLRAPTPLYYLPDQDMGRQHAVFVPFFGVAAATTTALSRLAHASGAAVVPCFPRQRRWGGYELWLEPPLADFPGPDVVADARRMNTEIERAVRRAPEQYFWVHKRFKTRPDPDAPKFYG